MLLSNHVDRPSRQTNSRGALSSFSSYTSVVIPTKTFQQRPEQSTDEVRENVSVLVSKLAKYRPQIVCFVSGAI